MGLMMDIKYLNECFDCDFATGTLTWKHRPLEHFSTIARCKSWNNRYEGKKAGSQRKDKYKRVGICDTDYLIHRVVYMMYTQKELHLDIDHIDGDPSNNSISNLREVTHSQNLSNQKRNSKNTSGYTGVYLNRYGKWCAQMKHKQKTWHLGSFEDINHAVSARKAEEKRLGFHENHGRNA